MISYPRRHFLQSGAASAALVATLGHSQALAAAGIRRVAFQNLHTGEALEAVYWEKGAYAPDVLARVNHVLRDFRTGDVHPIHPGLLDLLDGLRARAGTREPYSVISGYRSPKTNAMLHEDTPGVASNSLHMQGMAVDIRLGDVDLAKLHQAALTLRKGGVGFYPGSDFVHVDVGPVRQWAMSSG
jgi:uncharacterized protein YcbK (DUF882 family)